MLHKILSLLLVIMMAATAYADLSCLDRNGFPVPWWTVIKYPGNVTAKGIARYSYLDEYNLLGFQTVLGSNVDDPNEALPNTIEAINNLSQDHKNLLVFSNVPPNGTLNPNGAHAKAIIAFDNETQSGVYILYSFLEYPDVSSADGHINYTVPTNDSVYASHNEEYGNYAYCMSIDQEILGHIVDNLPVEQPDVYYASGLFTSLSPNSTKNYTISNFTLSNGDPHWFLTKSPAYNVSIYEGVVAPYFNVSLAVQSWGRPYQNSSCYPNPVVVNVDEIKVNPVDKWGIWADNSKWAITFDGTKYLSCLCDMDRTDDQSSRGGSCLCSGSIPLYKALTKIVTKHDSCATPSMIEV